ncbi:uncharacterized protein N7458_000333 [Penicillium daleae]|uniref:Uncharacterized protein n=1 Tax=Penicillium daleae TaxID=63821 RepID=A0AAD6CHK0_9EURO|nr:uncharacterized protein N7458_000333 [Penicillium daleae]KAJ5464647.1 hypothetical protein N7458_000333 [Penicillium daleae]
MQFTKTLLLLASALAPMAFAAEQAASVPGVTSTITLVPSGYTSPSSTPTPTPTSTPTPTNTPTPTSTPVSSSSSFSRVTSTPLIPSTSTFVETNTQTAAPAPASTSTSAHSNGASMRQVSGAMAAGVVAVAGLLMV